MFSVIIPTYNRQDFISKAIDSVVQQSFQDWELIIVDDGSTDETSSVLKNYSEDERIRVFFQKNKGRSFARNKGIKESKGDFICFLDSDDYYFPNHLDSFYKILEKNSFGEKFYYGHTFEDNNGKLIKVAETNYKGGNVFNFFYETPIGAPRVCLSRKMLIENCFDENLSIGEDNELWLRIMPTEVVCTKEFTQAYRNHDDRSVLNGEFPIFKNIELKKELYKKYKAQIKFSVYLSVTSFNYLKLARVFIDAYKWKAFKYLMKSLIYGPFKNTKEKVYLLKKSIW